MPVFNAAQDALSVNQPPLVGTDQMQGPYSNLGMVPLAEPITRDPAPLALGAMGEAAVADVDKQTMNMGQAAENIIKLEQQDESLKTDRTFQDRVSDFFGSRENMIGLALGFNSMRLQPDQGLASVLGAELKDLRSRKRSTESANRTVASLKALGTKEALQTAAMIEANPSLANEIYSAYVTTEMKKPAEQRKGETGIRKEFTGNKEVQDFGKQASAFGRVVASAKDPSAAGDLALIFNYMKVLDPGSTVREGEFATAQNAAGVPGRVLSLYNNIIKGERLNPVQRNDFVKRSRMLYLQAEEGYQGIRDQYRSIATDYGFDIDRTVPDLYEKTNQLANPVITFDQIPQAEKDRFGSEQEWNRFFNSLSYLKRLEFLEAL